MKKIRKSVLMTLIAMMAILNITFIKVNTVDAASVYKTDVSSPASNNVFITVNGTFLSESASKIVKRINDIRYEACKQGVINPDTGKKLTTKDYKPIVWSETLEAYARLRAAEASVNWSHTRPNNKSTFKNSMAKISNGYHSGENLAWGYTVLNSIEGYYSEKSLYLKNRKNNHYSMMISPENTLVGVAGFQQKGKSIFSAMEFGTIFPGKKNNNSSRQNAVKGDAIQTIEVNVPYLINSISISGAKEIGVGITLKATATANMKNTTKTAEITKGATWKSSNTKVATVDANGNVKGVKTGTATITVACGGKSASYKVTVITKNAYLSKIHSKVSQVTKAITNKK